MPFPEILLALRLSNGLTQQQLAERANVAEITIQNYEAGRSNPVPTRLLAIAVVRRVVMVYFTRFSMSGGLTWYIGFTSLLLSYA